MSLFTLIRKDKNGTAALEFAIVAPVFFMTIFTLIAYGIYFSASYAVQQIAADAARTAIAGLSTTERVDLARKYIQTSTMSYSFINKDRIAVDIKDDVSNINQFTVRVSYDSADLPIWKLMAFTLPNKTIERYATIRLGGL